MDCVIASVTAFATIVLAILTGIYVRLTHSMLKEMRKSRKPKIIIDFIKRIGHYQTKIFMTISNKGLSSAKEINFKKDGHTYFTYYIIGTNGKPTGNVEVIEFNELPIVKDGISYLAPGNDIRFDVGDIKNEYLEKDFKIKIYFSYKNEAEEIIREDILIDFRYIRKEDI